MQSSAIFGPNGRSTPMATLFQVHTVTALFLTAFSFMRCAVTVKQVHYYPHREDQNLKYFIKANIDWTFGAGFDRRDRFLHGEKRAAGVSNAFFPFHFILKRITCPPQR